MIGLLFGDTASIVCNLFTAVLFIIVLLCFAAIRRLLRKNHEDVMSAVHGRQMKRELEADATMRVVSGAEINPKNMNELKRVYDGICGKFDTVSQIIPVFPSIGILGTVLGLMMQLRSEGLEEMTDSIALALGTTLAALVATVILKFCAAFISGEMNRLEAEYRSYDREHQYLMDQNQLKEEK